MSADIQSLFNQQAAIAQNITLTEHEISVLQSRKYNFEKELREVEQAIIKKIHDQAKASPHGSLLRKLAATEHEKTVERILEHAKKL